MGLSAQSSLPGKETEGILWNLPTFKEVLTAYFRPYAVKLKIGRAVCFFPLKDHAQNIGRKGWGENDSRPKKVTFPICASKGGIARG